MHVIDAGEIFGMTFYTVDKILDAGGKHGPDALALYYKYIKQSRMQGTNQTYSLNEFMKGGLSRGDDRLKNAKKVLNKLGLIEDITKRDELGKIIGHYIKVNCIVSNKKAENSVITDSLSTTGVCQGVVEPRCGGTDTNALSNKNNKCLKKHKENTSYLINEYNDTLDNNKQGDLTFDENFEKYWNSFPRVRTRRKEVVKEQFRSLSKEQQSEIRKDALIYKLDYEQSDRQDKSTYVLGIDSFINNYEIDDYREQKLIEIIKRNKQLREESNDRYKWVEKFKWMYEVFGEPYCKELWKKYSTTGINLIVDGKKLN